MYVCICDSVRDNHSRTNAAPLAFKPTIPQVVDEADCYIHVEQQTPFCGFVDDIEFQLDAAGWAGGVRVCLCVFVCVCLCVCVCVWVFSCFCFCM